MPPRQVQITERMACGEGLPLLWIAGPCVLESAELAMHVARHLRQIRDELDINVVFKASFDKANRSSGKSFRGPGLEKGLTWLQAVRAETGLPVTTDIHETWHAEPVGKVVDILQIPAFLARQTDLLLAAGRTGRVVNVKKGQFMAPWDMKNVVAKLAETGNPRLLLTERGTTFGYNNLVTDMRAIPIMQELGCPVVFDATHSVQMPGGAGTHTGGDRRMIPYLAKAAVAVGCDAVFMEVHPRPDEALSDGPNTLPLADFAPLVRTCLRLRAALADVA